MTTQERKIVLRCDGGHEMGWGHVMRCAHLAHWLQGKFKVYFVIHQNKEVCEFLRGQGFVVFEIAERKDHETYEYKALNAVLALEPHLVINDIQDTTQYYMQELKGKNIKIVNIDDTSPYAKMAHVLVDANRKPKEGKCFGPAYMILSPLIFKMAQKKRMIHKQVKTILVSFGGSDPHNLTEKVLRALEGKLPPHVELEIIIGRSFAEQERLTAWGRYEHISFGFGIDTLAPLLLKADVAIIGGGVTMAEALCLGTPSVVIAQNKAQAKNARRIEKNSAIMHLGEGTKISDKKIGRKVLALMASVTQRERMSVKAKKEFDGKGIFRVLEQIEMLL